MTRVLLLITALTLTACTQPTALPEDFNPEFAF